MIINYLIIYKNLEEILFMKKALMLSTQSLIILAAAGTLAATAVSADSVISTWDSEGSVAFTENNKDIPDIVNPEVPNEHGDEGTEGALAVDYVSDLDFGSHPLSAAHKTYYAKPDTAAFSKAVAPFIEFHDLRGLGEGNNTSLTVTQVAQFNNGTQALTGASLSFSLGKGCNAAGGTYNPNSVGSFTLIPGQSQPVMETNGIAGQFLTSYGTASDYKGTTEGSPISLSVPSGSATKGNYTATLLWDLTTAP